MKPPNKEDGEVEYDELTMQNHSDGLSVKKTLEEFLAQKQVSYSLDITNFTLTIIINILQLWKTTDMCLFDAEPIWRLENESECKGQAHSIYYFFLGFAHFYFLVEFFVRIYVTKVPLASLKTFESFIEILTTVPYFLSLIIVRQVSGYDNEGVYWV